jgi:hypothetical protein
LPCWALVFTGLGSAFAQGTAFTYQGRLNDGTNPANGSYDLQCAIYDASLGGNPIGPTLTNVVSVAASFFSTSLKYLVYHPYPHRKIRNQTAPPAL